MLLNQKHFFPKACILYVYFFLSVVTFYYYFLERSMCMQKKIVNFIILSRMASINFHPFEVNFQKIYKLGSSLSLIRCLPGPEV